MMTHKKFFASLLSLVLVAAAIGAFVPRQEAIADNNLNVWWPTDGAHVSGTQPFKAQLEGYEVGAYEMFWEVDGGTWNWMDTNSTDYPHHEASVDVSGWNWHGAGPYKVTFIARQNGVVIAQRTVSIMIDSANPAVAQAPAASSTTVVSNSISTITSTTNGSVTITQT